MVVTVVGWHSSNQAQIWDPNPVWHPYIYRSSVICFTHCIDQSKHIELGNASPFVSVTAIARDQISRLYRRVLYRSTSISFLVAVPPCCELLLVPPSKISPCWSGLFQLWRKCNPTTGQQSSLYPRALPHVTRAATRAGHYLLDRHMSRHPRVHVIVDCINKKNRPIFFLSTTMGLTTDRRMRYETHPPRVLSVHLSHACGWDACCSTQQPRQ